jgi:hypothetical protein
VEQGTWYIIKERAFSTAGQDVPRTRNVISYHVPRRRNVTPYHVPVDAALAIPFEDNRTECSNDK